MAVTYADAGVFTHFGSPGTAVVALLPAAANGNRIGTTPVAEARIRIGALDSASILPQQTSTVADGVDRPIVVDVNSVRDNFGNQVREGTRLALTPQAWYRRSDGHYHNGSQGGALAGGISTVE